MSIAVGRLRTAITGRIGGGALLRYAPFAAGALLVAGIVHLAAILLAPRMASTSAVARLSIGEPNILRILPGEAGRNGDLPTPFADPALLTATCRFDLAEGPVRLRLQTGDQFLSVVALSPTGRVMLALTDRAATRRSLNIVLATPAQLRQLDSLEGADEDSQELRVRMDAPRGVVVVRTLVLREAERSSALALLGRAGCRQE